MSAYRSRRNEVRYTVFFSLLTVTSKTTSELPFQDSSLRSTPRSKMLYVSFLEKNCFAIFSSILLSFFSVVFCTKDELAELPFLSVSGTLLLTDTVVLPVADVLCIFCAAAEEWDTSVAVRTSASCFSPSFAFFSVLAAATYVPCFT